jgi:LacI family transcriptional regulator
MLQMGNPAARTTSRHGRRTSKIVDVARLARVSTATVSRALTQPQRVNADTLHRIEAAVKKLRYVPHGAARALRTRRTRTIGTVIPTLGNAIFANYTQALQQRLETYGYTLLLVCNEYDPRSEIDLVHPLIERGVEGMVLVGGDHLPQLFQMLDEYQIPYVLTWVWDQAQSRPCVGFDNRQAAAGVANFLLDLRHTRIAMISGITTGNDRARERVIGVREALTARGLSLAASYLLETPYTITAGREGMRALMRLSPRPTAVICGNDVLAIGAITECHSLGVEVPKQVSITGFDDMEMASTTLPPLSTVRVPTEDLGRSAADYIIARVTGHESIVNKELAVDLIIRGTTGPPPGS